jgi:CRP-like cAMP-binding protein
MSGPHHPLLIASVYVHCVADFVKRVPVLAKLSVEEKDRIAALLTEVSFADGAIVFEQGSIPNGFYIIKEGTAAVTQFQDGAGNREIARLGRGDYFGEAALLNSAPRGATVTAVGPLVCMFVDSEKFKGMIISHPLIALVPYPYAFQSTNVNRITIIEHPICKSSYGYQCCRCTCC